MKHQKITAMILVDDNEVKVSGNYYPGCKGAIGAIGANGEPMEPDDEPDIEIDSATDGDGEEFELSDEQREEAIQALWYALEYRFD